MDIFSYKIALDDTEERIDKWISNAIPDLSRSYIQKLIKDQKVCVNGIPQKASYRLKALDEITFEVPEASEPEIEPENIPLDILYEDTDLLIVNKPKNMVVHPAPGHYTGTLVNAVMYHCGHELSGINGILRPGIVHRIDKDTTGSLVICKNDYCHKAIAALLKEHDITRKYHAIVKGIIATDEGTITGSIGRHPQERKKMAINVPNGKHAVTHYKVLKRMQKHTYIECTLETGRTHQIRVHMASIGHPILGDEIYGQEDHKFHLQGQCLHAKVLGFVHPASGKYLEVDAPLPDYFLHLLEIL